MPKAQPSTEFHREELARVLDSLRIAAIPPGLGWLLLGWVFHLPSLYGLALSVATIPIAAHLFARRVRTGKISPERGVILPALAVSFSGICTAFVAPWAASSIVCAVIFGGLLMVAATGHERSGWMTPLTLVSALIVIATGSLAPVSDDIPVAWRASIAIALGLFTAGMVFGTQRNALRRQRGARKLVEHGHDQLIERERQLLRISQSPVLEEGDLLAACRLITSAAQVALGVQRASIWLFDDDAKAMKLTLLRDGETENPGPLALPYAQYPRYFAALRNHRVLLAHEARTDAATSEFATGYLDVLDIHAMLDAGIHFGGRSVGVLCCEHTGSTRRWNEQEGFFAGALADILSRALAAADKRKADEALQLLNAELETRVAERTAAASEAQRLAQEQAQLIELAQQRLLSITDSIAGLVYEYRRSADGQQSAPFVSSGVEQLLGLPRQAVLDDVGRFFGLVLPEDLAGYAENIQRSADEGVDHRYVFRVRHAASGLVRWMLASARAPQRDADGTLIWRGYVIDISDQKQLESELATASDAAAQASKAKSEFLANMSHEIRTPMNAIIGLSHLALKTELTSRQHDYINKIYNSAQSLLGIINDILDLSKIEAGKLGIENTEFDLLEVLDNLASLVSVKAEEKGLEFLISAAPGLPYFLVGDPLRLGQVLLNLAGNAVKFTGQGQVMVSVTEVSDSRSETRVGLRFAVSDTGIGLTQEQRGRLFQAFSQADASTTRKYGGTGLGLTISRQLAELMGGSIGVDSVPGQGSTFWFTITAGIATERRRAGRGSAEALKGRRVLVVDDNRSARNIVESYVSSFGMAPRQAASGDQAVQMVRDAQAEGRPFDLVLMDWQMPGLNGIEAAQKIRQLQASPKIVLLTAHAREDVIRSAEEARLDGFLVKPVNPSLLLDASLNALFGGALAGGGSRRDRGDENANSLRGLSVLLAEDNEINQQVAREVLEGFGVQVDIADNGRIALDLLRSARRDYSVVLMDMQMPEMDGLGATRAIRGDGSIARIPIIAMTANAMEADRQACTDAGMDDFISKPFKPKELLHLLRKWGRGESLAMPAEMAQAEPDAGNAQVFNIADGIDRVGNLAALIKLAQQFFGKPQAAVDAIPEQIRAGDREAAIRAAHSVVGAGSLLGFEKLASLARELETRLKQHHAIADALDAVQQAFAEARAALPAVAIPAPKTREPIIDAAELDRLLSQLSQQIENYDSQATETMANLRDFMGSEAPKTLAQLEEHISNFDFDGAAALLASLREALRVAGLRTSDWPGYNS